MKKYFAVILIGILLCNTSCERFLEENPATSLSNATVFNNEAGIESAMIGCYASFLNTHMWLGRMADYLGGASALSSWQGNRYDDIAYAQLWDFVYYSTDTDQNQPLFERLFISINRANSVIQALSESPVDESYKVEVEAEAKLIRAILYFTAVRLWGDLPLIVSPAATYEDAHNPRTSYLEVYKQILEDLIFAEENMRDAARQMKVTGGIAGRPNKWAATAFKAKVYIQMASLWGYSETEINNPYSSMPNFTNCGLTDAADAWRKALETCEKIMNEGPYELAPHFGQLFNWGYDPDAPNQFSAAVAARDYTLKERVFTINVTGNGTSASLYHENRSTPPLRNWGEASNSANGRFRVSRFVFQKFAETYGATKFTVADDGIPATWSGKLYKGDCKDPRFDLSYFHTNLYRRNASTVPFGATTGNVTVLPIYPNISVPANITTAGNECAPYYRKYVEPRYPNDTKGYADFYLLRYADVFLMAAEAAAELSNGVGDANWSKAMGYIEVIHRRARLSTPDGSEAPQPKWEANRFASKQDLVDAIFWERLYELTGEGHEWFDERRKGTAFFARNVIAPLNTFLAYYENCNNNSTLPPNHPNTYRGRMYGNRTFPTTSEELRYRMLCGFPVGEIDRNEAISHNDQNRYIIQ